MKYIDFFERTRDFFAIRQIVKNRSTVMLFRFGIKRKFTMKLRNGGNVKIDKFQDYFKFWDSDEGQYALLHTRNFTKGIVVDAAKNVARFKFNNKDIVFYYDSDKQLGNTYGMIREQFIEEQYKWLDVNGRDVVDIGANVGDSAVYFGFKAANRVYAFEPYPYSYNLAVKNVKANGLEHTVILLNEGCGKEISHITIKENYKNYNNTELRKFSSGKNIKITTLDEIIKDFNINNGAILKMDCEGCEYGIILNSPDSVLKKFSQIQIEYHYGYLNLKEKLESSGFTIRNTHPKYNFNAAAENQQMFIGMLYAGRQ